MQAGLNLYNIFSYLAKTIFSQIYLNAISIYAEALSA